MSEALMQLVAASTVAIEFYPDGVDDNPETHRWRARWDRPYLEQDKPVGIVVTGYEVIRLTPKGAWIETHPWRPGKDGVRLVSNTAVSTWAKPTKQAALHSLAVRLHRWAQTVNNDALRVLASADALERLAPDLAIHAKDARKAMAETLTILEARA